MKRKTTLSLVALFLALVSCSQKIKVQSGSFDFLKGQKEINVIFDYTGVTFYSKNLTEEEYISKRSDEIKDKNPEEDWAKTWQEYKDTKFPNKFFASANKNINKNTLVFSKDKITPYTLIVKTEWIKPGSPGWSKAEVSIIDFGLN